MATTICVLGDTGTGKSTSLGEVKELGIKGLDPRETCIINVMGKPLPFRGFKKNYGKLISAGGNYASVTSGEALISILNHIDANRPDIKNVVIDDVQYIMADEFMEKALLKGYDKFSQIGKHIYSALIRGKDMRDDINFIILSHSELAPSNTLMKMKTIGKMLDDKVVLEGLFTIVLYTFMEMVDKKPQYYFITNRMVDVSGITIPAKSPVGMFKDLKIKNDMGEVVKLCSEYYNS